MRNYSGVKTIALLSRQSRGAIFALALLFLLVLGHVPPIHAHPPGNMVLAYDAKAQSLSVTVTHTTSFPSKHYISTVDIVQNGKPLKSERYTSQPSSDTFTYTISVPASPGDVFTVKGTCSIFGSKEAGITIPGE
jgi:hypothetical protein